MEERAKIKMERRERNERENRKKEECRREEFAERKTWRKEGVGKNTWGGMEVTTEWKGKD